jgi:hypothetical protein
MHAIASVTVERQAIDGELLADVAEMDGEGPALAHGDVAHAHLADVVEQDDAVGAWHGLELRGMTALVAVVVFDAVR